jgi:NADH-quinone oxidoreductase subunit J
MDKGRQTRPNWWIPALLGVLILAGLIRLILNFPGVDRQAAALPTSLDGVKALGTALVSPNAYVLPFEVASVLMLAALVGAVYVATVDKKQENKR